MRSIANAKLGIETPASETIITAASIAVWRLSAAMMPMDIPRTTLSTSAAPASSSVAGSRCAMSVATG